MANEDRSIEIPMYRYEIFLSNYDRAQILKRFCMTEPTTSIRISDICRIFGWDMEVSND